jgi:hypothetical protein
VTATGFDVIGDVHGCADKLRGLLDTLGYRQRHGAYRHPGRQAIFVGDLIDRGTQQVETVHMVRSMVDAGTARLTMGNHEFNAISFATPDPANSGEFMRRHQGPKGRKNRDQHRAFLTQVTEAEQRQFIAWFRTLPLWLDLDGVRIVHACWHDPSIAVLARELTGSSMGDDFVVSANTKDTDAFRAVEIVLKGPEIELDREYAFRDGGHVRTAARLRWWDGEATTLRAAVEIPPGSTTPDGDRYPPLPDDPCPELARYRYDSETPVIFGHYWRAGTPRVDGPRTACVDFSAISGGPLVAYRFDGEPVLTDAHVATFGPG